MQVQQFEVDRQNLERHRIRTYDALPLSDGEIRVAVDRFALTANNITYGVVGEKIGYWQFFPCPDEWGMIPVWGFADVTESRHNEIGVGERLYGYWPMATHLTMQPGKVAEQRLTDGAAHRANLPPVYNGYARCQREPHYDPAMDSARMLLFPLYATSFCLYDYLVDNDYFGAEQVIIPSASSKTSIGLAYALADDAQAKPAVGITSAGNLAKTQALGLYDDVLTYDDILSVPDRPTVIVDMSGNGPVLAALHQHLGDNMKYTSNVGLTHYDDNQMVEGFIAARSKMFFAPGHMQKRAKDWGPGEFEKKAFAFWHSAATRSSDWLSYEYVDGMGAMPDAYASVLAGNISPETGLILSPTDGE
ncbi:MAG: DUF2855 family protein [Pseudomonadota bacterium]